MYYHCYQLGMKKTRLSQIELAKGTQLGNGRTRIGSLYSLTAVGFGFPAGSHEGTLEFKWKKLPLPLSLLVCQVVIFPPTHTATNLRP